MIAVLAAVCYGYGYEVVVKLHLDLRVDSIYLANTVCEWRCQRPVVVCLLCTILLYAWLNIGL